MSQRQLNISELIELLRRSPDFATRIGLMGQINNALPKANLDERIKNVLSSYLMPDITARNRYTGDITQLLINAWDQYQLLVKMANPDPDINPFIMHQQMQQLHRLLISDVNSPLFSGSTRARILSFTAAYENDINPFMGIPVRDIERSYHAVGEVARQVLPSVSQHQPTKAVPAKVDPAASSTDLFKRLAASLNQEPMSYTAFKMVRGSEPEQPQPANDVARYPEKYGHLFKAVRQTREMVNPLAAIFDISQKPAPIPMSIFSARHGGRSSKPVLYTHDALPELLKVAHVDNPSSTTKEKVVRFLLTTDNKLAFALEGVPTDSVPAHFQMADLDPNKAFCLTAGNAFFNEKGELCRINHKSGDFRPPYDSLQFVLPVIAKLGIPVAPELVIEQLDHNGVAIEERKISAAVIGQLRAGVINVNTVESQEEVKNQDKPKPTR